MKNLILLTNGYPFGPWETYLENEVEYYNDYFENIYICSLQVRKEHLKMKRSLPGNKFKICRIDYAPRYVYLLNSFRALADTDFYCEVRKFIGEKRFSFSRLVRLVVFITRSHYEAAKILKFLKMQGIKESEGLIYAYRFEYQSYVGMLIQKKYPTFKIIARGHGSDLFEERNNDAYIHMREKILTHMDRVFLIGEDGKNYLEKNIRYFVTGWKYQGWEREIMEQCR